MPVSSRQHHPIAVARDVPSRKPVVVVSGVLQSAWASNQNTARDAGESPARVPGAVLQLPLRTSGNRPARDRRAHPLRHRPHELEGSPDLGGSIALRRDHRGRDGVAESFEPGDQPRRDEALRARPHAPPAQRRVIGDEEKIDVHRRSLLGI